MECETCKKTFKTKSNLNYHRKTAKYCLKLRKEEEVPIYRCEKCDKTYRRKQDYKRHLESHNKSEEVKILKDRIKILEQQLSQKEKKIKQLEQIKTTVKIKNNQIKNLEQQNQELVSKLENVALKAATKSTTTNNSDNRISQVNNLIPLTEEHLQQAAEYLTLEHVQQGAIGYVAHAADHSFKDRVACTDFSRKKLKYYDDENNLVVDPGMGKIVKRFFKSIENKNIKLLEELQKKVEKELEEYNAKDSVAALRVIDSILTQKKHAIMIGKGEGGTTDLYKEFCRLIAPQLSI